MDYLTFIKEAEKLGYKKLDKEHSEGFYNSWDFGETWSNGEHTVSYALRNGMSSFRFRINKDTEVLLKGSSNSNIFIESDEDLYPILLRNMEA